jgi:hypothetical protein
MIHWRRIFLRIGLLTVLSVNLSSCADEIDEPLWPWTAKNELKKAIGFAPEETKLLYSWSLD